MRRRLKRHNRDAGNSAKMRRNLGQLDIGQHDTRKIAGQLDTFKFHYNMYDVCDVFEIITNPISKGEK